MENFLELKNVVKTFGKLMAVNGLNLCKKEKGGIHALIGPNGAGKTTLYNLISGKYPPTSGKIFFKGEDITGYPVHKIQRKGIARSFQITNIFKEITVLQNLQVAAIAASGKSLNFFRPIEMDDEIIEKSFSTLRLIGLEGKENFPCAVLPYGDTRKLEIGIALVGEPELLLLDEPTAGMNPIETREMAKLIKNLLKKLENTFFITEHDMDVVFSISDYITVMHEGKILAEGIPDEIKEEESVRKAYFGEKI